MIRTWTLTLAVGVTGCGLLVDTQDVAPPCAGNADCEAGWYCLGSTCQRLLEPEPCAAELGPGAWAGQTCGLCGLQVRQCLDDGYFGPWSACAGQGECAPETHEVSDGRVGATLSRTCSAACSWGRSQCTPGCETSGRECGDDGCGGTCGRCHAPYVCSPYGLCGRPADAPDPGVAAPDAAALDGGPPDGGEADSGDAGLPDAAGDGRDAAALDAGLVDASADIALVDATPVDAALVDASLIDAALIDGTVDATPVDTASIDATPDSSAVDAAPGGER